MALYLYDTEKKQLYESNSMIVLNPEIITVLKNTHANDLLQDYGRIIVDETTLAPKFEFYRVNITVDKENNPSLANSATPMDQVHSVIKKDYVEAIKNRNKGKLIKFFNNEFYIFDNDYIKDYDPETNTFKINIKKLKIQVKNKILNSEQELRNHGFYYNYWPDENIFYLQPFRVTPDNDLQVLKTMKEDLPTEYKALKLFKADKYGRRMTTVGSYRWLKGKQVLDELLQYQILLITSYSGYIKDTIYQMSNFIEAVNDIETLMKFDVAYIDIIIKEMSKKLEAIPELITMKTQLISKLKVLGIKPIDDILL